MKSLIPGGAGYTGSHMVRYAQEHGYEVVVLDDSSSGHEWAVRDCEIPRVNLLDQDKLSQLLKERHFDGVVHFAAKSLLGGSVKKPNLHYRNKFVGTLNLVNEVLNNDVNNLVFSSTASIFGNTVTDKVAEDHPKKPISPYGQSKFMVENMLQDICTANDSNATCLRYFNAAWENEFGETGAARNPKTHLIPNVLKAALSDKSNLKVFGSDYPASDGTFVRDYEHISSVAQAHLLSLEKMTENFSVLNWGIGSGCSVGAIINSCEKATNMKIEYQVNVRRKGDPAMPVADSNLALAKLGWNPSFLMLDLIVCSALKWHKSRARQVNERVVSRLCRRSFLN
jgi:UDP-glucose 4-epimerase